MEPLPHIKQDPEYVDAGATFLLYIVSLFVAGVAFLLYKLEHPTIAFILAIASAVGVSFPRVPYSRWLKRREPK